MAKAERTEVFNIDINKFYSIIEDYSSYPDFVDGVSSSIMIFQVKLLIMCIELEELLGLEKVVRP